MEVEIITSGIYFLVDEKEIIYIGQSMNITRRVITHSYKYDKCFI